jgi:hypothetical protein
LGTLALAQIDVVLSEWQSAEGLLRELPRDSAYFAAVKLAAETLRAVCAQLQAPHGPDSLQSLSRRAETALQAIRAVRVATVSELLEPRAANVRQRGAHATLNSLR